MDSRGNIRELISDEEMAQQLKKAETELQGDYKKLAKMNREIKDKATPRDDEIKLSRLPNPNCNDCFGRGHITRIIQNIRKVEPCHCVLKG